MDPRTIHIVGAGPAGLAAAITVARAGHRAVVHELGRDVGSRFRDDFQGLENWSSDGSVLDELRAAGIEPTFEHIPVSEQVGYGPDGSAFTFHSDDAPFYYIVRRGPREGTVDRALLSQALAAGAEVRFQEPIHHLPEGGIVAHGPRGAGTIAVGYVFAADLPDGAFAALNNDLAPGGYAYLLIHGGQATLASCMFRDFHKEKVYLRRAVEFFQERVGFRMGEGRRFGGRGNFWVPATATQGRILFAGEAIGFQDALWGFGMRYAMLSGHLAALCLIEDAPRSFDRRWEERLGGPLRAALVNRHLYGTFGHLAYRYVLRRLARAESPRRWLGRQYAPSRWKQWLYPFVRRAVVRGAAAVACDVEGCDCTWCRSHRAEDGRSLERSRPH
jgi:flavin-dependent dehydrogenase